MKRVLLGLAAMASVGLMTPAMAMIGGDGSNPPSAPVEDVPPRLTSADRAGASAPMDDHLAQLLADTDPGGSIEVMVHADTLDAAATAARSVGLPRLGALRSVGVVLTAGTPADIRELAAQPGVAYLEANARLRFDLDRSHLATRGAEARTAFLPKSGGTTGKQPGYCKNREQLEDRRDRARGGPDLSPCVDSSTSGTFADEIDGTGVGIAIVDSGIDGTNPFFQREDGTSKVVRNLDIVRQPDQFLVPTREGEASYVVLDNPTNNTENAGTGGHGTHVAGIAAGVDHFSEGLETTLHGAAPDASLYGLSIGVGAGLFDANVALEWILDHHANPCDEAEDAITCDPIRVINNSYGAVVVGASYDPNSATAKIQDMLVAEGVVMVWAAGNGDTLNDGGDGKDIRTNANGQSPTPGIVMVANYDDANSGTRDGVLSSSSSRGLRTDERTWPDLSAPGTQITSSCAIYLDCGVESADSSFGTISGTSMAAPHVAGIVAQLLEVRPTLTPADIEDVLEDTAYEFTAGAPYAPDIRNDGFSSFDKGHGLVDVKAAVAQLLDATIDPSVPPSACGAGDPVVVDSVGDSSNTLTDSSNPSTDAVGAHISAGVDGAGNPQLMFTLEVAELQEAYPDGVTGQFWDLEFQIGGTDLMVIASRNQLDGPPPSTDVQSFKLGRTRDRIETLATGLAGGFDFDSDTIWVVVTQADLDAAQRKVDEDATASGEWQLPALADLPYLSSIEMHAREATYVVAGNLVLLVDTGAGVCAFHVGDGVIPTSQVPLDDGSSGTEEPVAPPDGYEGPTITRGGAPLEWSGAAPASPVFPLAGIDNCQVVIEACHEYEFFVDSAGTLGFTGTFADADDWDFWLYDAGGNEVGQAASSSNPESFTADLRPGVYTLRAMPFTALGGYDGRITLTDPA